MPLAEFLLIFATSDLAQLSECCWRRLLEMCVFFFKVLRFGKQNTKECDIACCSILRPLRFIESNGDCLTAAVSIFEIS